jgi:hypothetical protein
MPTVAENKLTLSNLLEDAADFADAMNTNATITPRTGAAFSSVPKLIADKGADLDAETANAARWAAEDEDTVVSDGLYSALHYAAKASASAASIREYNLGTFANDAAAEAFAVSNGTLAAGDEYFNTTVDRKRVYDGANWYEPGAPEVTVSVANGGTGATTAQGAADNLSGADWLFTGTFGANASPTFTANGVTLNLVNQNAQSWTIGQNVVLDEFTIRDATAGATRLHIDDNGFIGTGGVNNPLYRFHNNGTMFSSSLVLTTDLAVDHGGTGASTIPAARVNLALTDIELPNGQSTGVASASWSVSEGDVIRGVGQDRTELVRDENGGNLRAVSSTDFVEIRDLTLNNNYSVNADEGHVLSLTDCEYFTIENVRVTNFGNNGGSAGTGIIAAASAGTITHGLIDRVRVDGDVATSTDTNGVLIVDGRKSIISKAVVENIISFAAEYKNDTRYSLMSDIIADTASGGIVFGQNTAGVDGVDYCAVSNATLKACDQGVVLGEATYNVIGNIVNDSTSAPGTDIYGVHLSTDSNQNVVHHILNFGANADFSAYVRGDRNYVSIAAHDTASDVVTLSSGAEKNFFNILHPGARTSIFSSINDASGFDPDSTQGNVIHSPATGEYQGTLSGRYHWKLDPIASPGSLIAGQNVVFENDGDLLLTVRQPGTSGQVGGLSINTPSGSNYAGMQYNHQGGGANDYWQLLVGDIASYRFFTTTFRTVTDNTASLGTSSVRWQNVWAYMVDATTSINTAGAYQVGGTTVINSDRIIIYRPYTIATLPSAVTGGNIYVSDETGGAIPAFSDGTNWRRYSDRAVVS